MHTFPYRTVSPGLLLLSLALGSTLPACGASRADEESTGESGDALVESSQPRKGSTISSPSVDPNKTYWGARSVAALVGVGALSALEKTVANRADGIIANQPPNGRLGVDELAALESPGHASSLFPAEKAVIPKLWALLEQAAGTPTAVAVPPIVKNIVDITPQPVHMPVNAEPALEQIARRIELTQDDDGDDQTISGRDVFAAYADRGSYLPAEVARFVEIDRAISARSPRLAADADRIEITGPAVTTSIVFSSHGLSLEATSTKRVVGRVTIGQVAPSIPPAVEQTTALALVIANGASARAILIDPTTGEDRLIEEVALTTGAIFEIWSGGARVAQFDVTLGASVLEEVPFGRAVRLDGKTWVMRCSTQECVYTTTPLAGEPSLPSGSYFMPGGGLPDRRFDLFANGRGVLTEGSVSAPCYPGALGANGHAAECRVGAPLSGRIYFGSGRLEQTSPELGLLVVDATKRWPLYPL